MEIMDFERNRSKYYLNPTNIGWKSIEEDEHPSETLSHPIWKVIEHRYRTEDLPCLRLRGRQYARQAAVDAAAGGHSLRLRPAQRQLGGHRPHRLHLSPETAPWTSRLPWERVKPSSFSVFRSVFTTFSWRCSRLFVFPSPP